MSMTSPAPGTRWFATGRLVWGAFLLKRPGRMFDGASHTVGDTAAHRVTVALGVRETVQAGLGLIFTGPVALRAGAAVDATHAVSMLAVAACSQRYRRPALVSAGVAGAAALVGLALTERDADRPFLFPTRGTLSHGAESSAHGAESSAHGAESSAHGVESSGSAGTGASPAEGSKAVTATADTARSSQPGHPRLIFALGGEALELPEDDRLIRDGFELRRDVSTIGSAPSADLRLEGVAALQARVVREAGELIFVNVSTTSPSRVNGAESARVLLRTGDRIEMGQHVLSYFREEFADHGSEELARRDAGHRPA